MRRLFLIFSLLLIVCSCLYADLPGFPLMLEARVVNSGATVFNDYTVRFIFNTEDLIADGYLQSDGDDLRVTDASDNLLPFWLGEGINTAETELFVRLPVIAANSTQAVHLYMGNPAASSLSSLSTLKGFILFGEALNVNEAWTTVSFSESFPAPPYIFATPATEGGEEASVRIQNITASGFEVRLDNYDDQAFPDRSVFWAAVTPGEYITYDEVLVESHLINTDRQVGNNDGVSDSYETVSFNLSFSSVPIVIAQVQTYNDANCIVEAIQNVTVSGCQLSGETLELDYGDHSPEDYAVLAMSYPERNSAGIIIETLDGSMQGRDDNLSGYISSFQESFPATPLIIADMQDRNGNNGGFLAVRSRSQDAVWVYTEEDTPPVNGGGRDTERSHTTEGVGIIAAGSAGLVALNENSSYKPLTAVTQISGTISFANGDQNIDQGTVSAAYTIENRDAFGLLKNVSADLTVMLKSTSPDLEFSLTASPFIPIASDSVVIPAGASSADFYVQGDTAGDFKITAAESPPLQGYINPVTGITLNDISAPGTFISEVVVNNIGGPSFIDQHVLFTFDSQSLISQGLIKADGSDLRFFSDEALTSSIQFWIDGGLNTTATRIWLNVPSITADSTETFYMTSNSPLALPASKYQGVMVPMESGSVSAADSWVNVLTDYEYVSPVIVALSSDSGGSDEEASIRIQNVTPTGFELKLSNPGDRNLGAQRSINYFVMEEGSFMLPDTQPIVGGQHLETHVIGSSSGDNSYSTINIPAVFSSPPAVFSQMGSYNDATWCSEHIVNTTVNSFESAMERGQLSGGHGAETIHWVAVESDIAVNSNNNMMQTMRTPDNIQGHDNGCFINNFPESFSAAPVVLADIITRDGSDGGFVTRCAVTADYIGLHVDEENESDNESSHTTETAAVMAFENPGVFPLVKRADNIIQAFLKLNPASISFITTPQTVTVGLSSDIYTFELQDVSGNTVITDTDLTFTLLSDSAEAFFSLNQDFSSYITEITIPAGFSSASFYYKDNYIGIHSITVNPPSGSGIGNVQQQVVVQDILLGAYTYDIAIDNSACPSSYTDFQVPIIIDTQNFISQGKMETDARDIRFYTSDGITRIPYWIEGGINTANTVIWLKVPEVAASSVTDIEMHYGNSMMASQSSAVETMENAETGVVSADENWQVVGFTGTYRDPVVITTHIEAADSMEIAPRVRSLGSGFMELAMIQPGGLAFNAADVTYFVCESGHLTTLDGSRIFADRFLENIVIGRRTGNNSNYENYVFSDSSYFVNAPLVFAQVMSDYDSTFITDHVRNPGTAGFDIALEAAEAVTVHAAEDMGIVAIENGISENLRGENNIYIETGRTSDNVTGHDNGWRPVSFSSAFSGASSSPAVITDMQTRDGADGGWAVTNLPSSSGFSVHIEEDRVNDSERSHTSEVVAWSGFSGQGFIPLRKYSPCLIGADLSGLESLNIVRMEFDPIPLSIAQGESSPEITVHTQGADGTDIAVQDSVEVTLSADSLTAEFSEDGINWSDSLSLNINTGSDSAGFYFRDSSSGSVEIRASEFPSRGWADALGTIQILKRKLAFITPVQSIFQGDVSALITIQSQSETGFPSPMSENTVITLDTTSAKGEFSTEQEPFTAVSSVIIPVNESEVSFYYRDMAQGTHILRADENPEKGWGEAVQEITVLPADEYFIIEAPQNVYSGEEFPITVTIYNNDGTVKTDYTGEVDFIPVIENLSSSVQDISIISATGFVNGINQLILRYDDAAVLRIYCSDKEIPEINGSSNEIVFLPYAFVFDNEPSRDQKVSLALNAVIRAVNIFGNVTPGFNRSIFLQNEAGEKPFIPQQASFNEGLLNSEIISTEWGLHSLVVNDPYNSDTEAKERNILGKFFFHADSFEILINKPPGQRKFYYTDENFNIALNALDVNQQHINSFKGAVNIDSKSGGMTGKGLYDYEKLLEQSFIVELSNALEEEFNFSIQEEGYDDSLTISKSLKVIKPYIRVNSVTGPVGTLTLKVQLEDKNGSIITDDSTTSFKLLAEEAIKDNSFTSDNISEFKEFSRGVAFLTLNNNQAEKVDLSADSDPLIEVIPGEAVFITGGVQVDEGGLRIDYWREMKE